MKSTILIFAALIIPALLFAQPKEVSKIFDKYAGKEGFTNLKLSDPSMLFGNAPADAKDAVKNVKAIRVLVYNHSSGKNAALGKEFNKDLSNLKKPDGYDEFMSVNEGTTNVKIYVNKPIKSDVAGMLMVVVESDKGESVIIWLDGAIDMKNVGMIGKYIGKGMKN